DFPRSADDQRERAGECVVPNGNALFTLRYPVGNPGAGACREDRAARGEGRSTMSDGSIAIVGGGVAGLAAGCYARMNGYRTRIFEMHDLPGGVCTSWRRDGYVFDGCLEWLMGSRAGSPLNHVWQELGALAGR